MTFYPLRDKHYCLVCNKLVWDREVDMKYPVMNVPRDYVTVTRYRRDEHHNDHAADAYYCTPCFESADFILTPMVLI